MGLERHSLGFPAAPKTTAENQYLLNANHMQALCFHVRGFSVRRRIK